MIEIVERSPITTWISDQSVIKKLLRYKTEWWEQGPYRMEKSTGYITLVKKNYFLSGFQKKVFDYLDARGLEYSFEAPEYPISCQQPMLKGIDFKKWLQDIPLEEMIKRRRGVWEAPTGAGKTVILAGLPSAFYGERTLVIVPTQGIFHQTIKELQRWYDGNDLGWIGDGERKEGDIVVAIINSLAALKDLSSFGKQWGMVIVDEAHRVSSFKGMYFKVLTAVQAPLRFALTGTMPEKEVAKWALEGLIGPWMGRTEEKELEEIGVLAKPKLKIIKIPQSDRVREMKSYQDVYEWGVIKYRKRNLLIMEAIKEELGDNGTGLIFVLRIRHGLLLEELVSSIYGPDQVRFVVSGPPADITRELEAVVKRGDKLTAKKQKTEETLREWSKAKGVSKKEIKNLENEIKYLDFTIDAFADDVGRIKGVINRFHEISKRREEYRLDLEARKYRIAIATTSWKEGINIPSLDLVWNATGAKSGIMNVQFFGRGRRATETKDEVILGDCFDSTHPFLVDAFGDRISLYCDKGWL